ncbi:MAG: Gfo/Idh/MocA family protein [Bacteroidales bacterium]
MIDYSDNGRRAFIKKSAIGVAGMAFAGNVMASGIVGANDKINVGIIGLRSRAKAHLGALAKCRNVNVIAICDVDKRFLEEFSKLVEKDFGKAPKYYKDYRKLLEDKNIDLITIATPEHWHTIMAIDSVKAGKHVYVEKPCSHNPHECELIVEAQKKYGKLIQMGNQQRSSSTTKEAVARIQAGDIGDAVYGKSWYANSRGSIGRGKQIPVPDYLDWELWQGPAPRRPYADNIHPYNWHWFKDYGTGEALNNALHEIDVCMWALGVSTPDSITSTGGRFHFKDDDWEFFDTQTFSLDYNEGKQIVWEGRSCNGMPFYGRGRGATIHGTKGTFLIDRNGYELYDLGGKKLETVSEKEKSATTNTVGMGGLDVLHMQNLLDGIREGKSLHSPIEVGALHTKMCLISNIAQFEGKTIELNRTDASLKDKKLNKKYWSREYAKGWEIKL